MEIYTLGVKICFVIATIGIPLWALYDVIITRDSLLDNIFGGIHWWFIAIMASFLWPVFIVVTFAMCVDKIFGLGENK